MENSDSQITREKIVEVAKQCFDPEIPVNIWDLGLIYDIDCDAASNSVKIRMSLTAKACPAAQEIPNNFKHKITTLLPVQNVDIDVVFDPPWTPERISEAGKRQLGLTES